MTVLGNANREIMEFDAYGLIVLVLVLPAAGEILLLHLLVPLRIKVPLSSFSEKASFATLRPSTLAS